MINSDLTDEQAMEKASALYEKFTKSVTYVDFDVLRDGSQLYMSKVAAGQKPDFTTADKSGDEAYQKVTIHVEGESGWEKTALLPRYDNTGREYKYELLESGGDWAEDTWVNDGVLDYTLSTADPHNTDAGSMVPQLSGTQTNVMGPGAGDHRFEVRKVWLDGSDLMTRNPVQVSLYRCSDLNDTAKTPVLDNKGNPCTMTLDESNGWHGTFYIPSEGSLTDYIILEDGIQAREFVPAEYEAGYPTLSGADTQKLFTENDGLNFDVVEERSGRIAYSDSGSDNQNDGTGALKQMYNVYIACTNQEFKEADKTDIASYTIYNQRTAVVDLTLEKLPYGVYRFEETQAPEGYEITNKHVEFTINAHNQDTKLAVFQVDHKPSGVPKTGDRSHVALGAAVMLASAAGLTTLLVLRKKRKK